MATFKDYVWALSGAVFLLHEWSLGGYRKWDDALERCLALSKYAVKQAERFSDNWTFPETAKLIMSSKILENLTNPDDAVVSCLQLLQQFHDMLSPLKMEDEYIFRQASCINRVLFEFANMVIKPPPNAEDWPVTIKFDKKIINSKEIPKRVRKEIFRPNYLDGVLKTTGNRYKCTMFMIFIKQTMKRTNERVGVIMYSFMFNFLLVPFSAFKLVKSPEL